MQPTIIVPAFSRPRSLERLLDSISAAELPERGVQVVVSLDGGFEPSVQKAAERFRETFAGGTVDVIARESNLGLKEHILWCGDQTEKFGSVIVLEDDLIVGPHFYEFACAAEAYFAEDISVAGISLYSQLYNEYANLSFTPTRSSVANYLMQVPSSWGQLWTVQQWRQFREWYKSNQDADLGNFVGLPRKVAAWSARSWKKFYAAYLIDESRYFVYPFDSHTSNCGDAGGSHGVKRSDVCQVPLCAGLDRTQLQFAGIDDACYRYDAFMELLPNADLKAQLGDFTSLTFDIFGSKPLEVLSEFDYCVTSRRSRAPMKRYPLRFKPVEANLKYDAEDGENPTLVLTKTDDVIESKGLRRWFERARLASYQADYDLSDKRLSAALFLTALFR